MKGAGGSVMLSGAFSRNSFGAVIPLEGNVNANHNLMGLSDHLHPMLQHFFPAGRGVFQVYNVHLPQSTCGHWFDEHHIYVIHMSWPSPSPDLNPNRAFMGYSGTTPESDFYLHQTGVS